MAKHAKEKNEQTLLSRFCLAESLIQNEVKAEISTALYLSIFSGGIQCAALLSHATYGTNLLRIFIQ